jgi:hypothetical protein
MDKNRFKELMKSTLGNVKPLISEQGEPTTTTTPTTGPPTPTAVSSGTGPNLILAKDSLKIISKNTPIPDEETRKNIYYVLKVLFGVTPNDKLSLDERMRKYDNRIKEYDLSGYLPSSELIVKLKEIQ